MLPMATVVYNSPYNTIATVNWFIILHSAEIHENPKPKGQPSISLPAQANLTQQKAEPLRCLALRTRGGRLKSSFVPWELSHV